MAGQTTYLELSEDDGTAHKFYEVTVDGDTLTLRYGRIGDHGQVRSTIFADTARASSAAAKKIGEKIRKGYAPATPGARQRRPVSRRQIVSSRSTAHQAPVLWRYRSGEAAFGVFVDDDVCMVGNEAGLVTTLTHDARVTGQFRLPDGVKCIVADAGWLYAGCDDGNVYDLSGKIPRVAYRIAPDIDIYWLDIFDGVLGVSDADGGVAAIDHEDEILWRKRSRGSAAWMVRCDEYAVHHGHSRGVTSYDWRTGREMWHQSTRPVLFGWQEEDAVYAGTSGGQVMRFGKDGGPQGAFACDSAVFSCASAPAGRYVFAGDNCSSVYCFDDRGTRLWKLGTGCGSAYSMQYHRERLYIVTTDGSLACLDASEAAVHAAQSGTIPSAVDVLAPVGVREVTPAAPVRTVSHRDDPGDDVIVECFDHRGRLRVRVLSPGYHEDWWVQFPKDIREAGARYLVPGVRVSERGGFYRAFGEIRRLV
ncbi:MAG: hypothetical protein QG622_794 [Actinomycetota bacterium]|nr:hypothetical protein [Actinomycetota bacterium]